jgi:hypothetical protein
MPYIAQDIFKIVSHLNKEKDRSHNVNHCEVNTY